MAVNDSPGSFTVLVMDLQPFEPTFPPGHSPDCPHCGVDDAAELAPRYFECRGCGHAFEVPARAAR